ncbi:internalin-like protein (LPXTG motif) Lmo0333 homolog [Photobacterium aphoticum]|uniref:Internalin-like protein (LPXTG motif) Lmo0333 homolog n=1 Tax=Photobacterium aphoticum TaxID=754436 RepID=A0A090QTN3_9GAMM|nr:internalin-like protein (LPXTG motif) Lmo0333 homolog [Photobacterium aphoticum]
MSFCLRPRLFRSLRLIGLVVVGFFIVCTKGWAEEHLPRHVMQSPDVQHVFKYYEMRGDEMPTVYWQGEGNVPERSEKFLLYNAEKFSAKQKKIIINGKSRTFHDFSLSAFIVLDNELNVSHLQLSKLDGSENDLLQRLKHLKYLSIYRNNMHFNDFDLDLSNNIKLKELNLKYGDIKNVILPVSNTLEKVVSRNGYFHYLTNLKDQNKLSTLILNDSVINIDEINGLDIQFLHIDRIKGERLPFDLSSLKKLKVLELYMNMDTEIKYNWKNKTGFQVSKDDVFERFEVPDTVRFFRFGGDRNTHVPFFKKGNNLKTLIFFGTNIHTLHGLDNLQQLEVLDISNSPIAKISGLDKLDRLKRLSIRYTQIDEVKNISHLDKLEYLNVNHNKITRIDDLSPLWRLNEIDISWNKLADISSANFPLGSSVRMFYNPLYVNADPFTQQMLKSLYYSYAPDDFIGRTKVSQFWSVVKYFIYIYPNKKYSYIPMIHID